MPQRRLLSFDGTQLRASLWLAGRLQEEGRFAADETGVAALREYARAHRGQSTFYFLADVVEEGFQLETLPYTQGADRKALLARKLSQFFYGTPYTTTISLGREKAGRRDERVLFAGLTRPQAIELWMTALRAEGAQLAGIYTPALIARALLRQVAPGVARCVLVSIGHSGIRQTFFDDGQLRFSRLSPSTAASAADIAQACVAESDRIYQYLAAQRMVPHGVALPNILMVHPSQSAAFVEACRSAGELRYQILDLHEVARKIGLKTPPESSYSEPVFLHLLGANPPAEQFAPPEARHYYRLWQARFALVGAGAVIMAGCLLFAGKQMVEALTFRTQNELMSSQAEHDSERYAAILRGLPPVPTSTENLRALIDRYQNLEKRSPSPLDLYLAISRALQDFPRIEVDKIDWATGDNAAEGGAAAGAAHPAAPAATERSGGNVRDTATVYAQLPPSMLANQRALLNTINAFAAALRAGGKLEVSIARMPFDIESGKSLKGGGEEQGKAEPPRFVVRVTRSL